MMPSASARTLRMMQSYRPSPHSRANKAARAAWGIAWLLLFRPSPKPLFGWRRWLLRRFGARIGEGANIHASVRIWAPWNLEVAPYGTLSPFVDCYCVATIRIGRMATVSQYAFLCAASHDPDAPDMPLTTAPISIGDHAWVAADAFVGPGVRVGEGAVLGARASAFSDLAPWTVHVGTPARPLRARVRAKAQPETRAGASSGDETR